ncbi:MAG: Txe/YoeB family addiction module toxin [Cyanobium sp.]
MSWTALFTRQAQKDARRLASASPALKQNAQALLELLAVDPYQQPPPYEALVGELRGACSRRINIQHRLDGKGLGVEAGGYFEALVLGPSAAWLVEQDWLARPKVFSWPGARNSKLRRRMGDFDLKQAARAFGDRAAIGDAVSHYRRRLHPGTAICFCCTIEHAEQMATAFRKEAPDRWAGHRRGGGAHQLHDHFRGHRHPLGGRRDPDAPHRRPEPLPADGRPGPAARTGEERSGDPRSRRKRPSPRPAHR